MFACSARRARVVLIVGGTLLLTMMLSSRLRAQAADPAAVVTAYYAALEKHDLTQALALVQTPSVTTGEIVRILDDIGASAMTLMPPPPQTPLRGCSSNVKNIATALEMYSTDNSGRYPRQLAKLSPDYLRTIPTCPAAHSETYSASYAAVSNPDAYTVFCSGTNHSADGIGANHPEYNSTTGFVLGAATANPQPTPICFKIQSMRILGSSVGDNKATVRVVENYTVFDYPARVFTTYPLLRDSSGWRIDGAALASSDDPQVLMTSIDASSGRDLNMRRFNWLRIHGLGAMVASTAGYYSTAEGKKALPVHQLYGCLVNLKNNGTALEMYATDNAGRYPDSLGRLAPNYLKRMLKCPAAGADTYSASYQYSGAPDAYTVFCKGHFHAAAGLESNFPAYTSTQGLLRSSKEGKQP